MIFFLPLSLFPIQSSSFSRHRKTHTGLKSHVCSYSGCGKSFTRRFNLISHQDKKHTLDQMN